MGNPQAAELAGALRLLPSTDELVTTPLAAGLVDRVGRQRLTSLARQAIEEIRQELSREITTRTGRAEAYSKESLLAAAGQRLEILWESRQASRLRKVINCTGVIIHTNLGRAPLSRDAINAIEEAAGYTTLEFDLASGKRGRRGASVEGLLTELTGAEAALVVNNCAAAAFLVLTVFAKGGTVIVSRGELVEIGGDFRIPDVLAQSGATLVEVGTTNRTKLADYDRAISESTKLVMRVHPSNYRIVGFTEKPSLAELSELCVRKSVLLYEDAGSGALEDLTGFGLTDEPLIGRSIADGADIVTFSGDKLLGACQAGLVVGRSDLIEQVRRHPLYRALRVDKLAYAVLESTLESYRRDDPQSIPVLSMLASTKGDLEKRTRAFAERLKGKAGTASVGIVDGESVVGGGSAPDVRLATTLISVGHPALTAHELEQRLRSSETPVIARIENDDVLLDLRTVEATDEDRLLELLAEVLVLPGRPEE